MTNAISMNERIAAVSMSAESRARALQAAYIGEVVHNAVAGLGRVATRLYSAWRERVELRRSVAHLRQLDERLLADIGLTHADLDEALRGRTHLPARLQSATAVDAVIVDAAPTAVAANQDREAGRQAA